MTTDPDDSHEAAALAHGARPVPGAAAWRMRPRSAGAPRLPQTGAGPPGPSGSRGGGTLLAMSALWPTLPDRVLRGRRLHRTARDIGLVAVGALLAVLLMELRAPPEAGSGRPAAEQASAGGGPVAPAGADGTAALAPGGALVVAMSAGTGLQAPRPPLPVEPLVAGGAVVRPPPGAPRLRMARLPSGVAAAVASEAMPEPAAGPTLVPADAPASTGAPVADGRTAAHSERDQHRLAGLLMYEIASRKQRSGDVAGAIAVYRRAAELVPDHGATHYDWGYLLQQKGDVRGAIEQYREAIGQRPTHPFAHYNLGWLLQREGYQNSAIAHYRRAVELNPTHAFAHYGLAWLVQQRGDRRGAMAGYRRALELDPALDMARTELRDLLTVQARSLAGPGGPPGGAAPR